VEHQSRETEPPGSLQLLDQDFDRALAEKPVVACEVEEVRRVGKAETIQPRRQSRAPEPEHVVLGERRRRPPAGGALKKLQRLAPARAGRLDRPPGSACGG
jgi:hypothetical protein